MADRVRVQGGGFTYFKFEGSVLAFAEEVRVTTPTPVAPEQRIQPLNAQRPVEIVTAGAHTGGTLTMVLTELYSQAVWQRLSARFNGAQDIVDIMRVITELDPANGITVDRFINPPMASKSLYHETYYGCVITRVADDETINVGAMSVNKEIDVAFTHSKKMWINGGNRLYPFSGVGSVA